METAVHLSEFKAWFEGFTDGIEALPSPKQWAKIQERVGEITNDYTSARVFHDHYWRPYYSHFPFPAFAGYSAIGSQVQSANSCDSDALVAAGSNAQNGPDNAFAALGKADFASLAS